MKFKTAYIYPLVIVLVFVGVIIFSNKGNENVNRNESMNMNRNQSQRQMPDDSIHSGMGSSMGGLSDEYLNRINMLRSKVRQNPNDTAAMRRFADLLSASHKLDSAIVFYEKILNEGSNRTDIMLGLTAAHYSKGDLQKAKEYSQKVLQLNSENIQARFNLAAVEASMGNEEKAKQLWQKVIADYPESKAAELAKNAIKSLGKQN